MVDAQQPVRQPVKGANPHLPRQMRTAQRQAGSQPREHLPRRFVGEGDGEDVVRCGKTLV